MNYVYPLPQYHGLTIFSQKIAKINMILKKSVTKCHVKIRMIIMVMNMCHDEGNTFFVIIYVYLSSHFSMNMVKSRLLSRNTLSSTIIGVIPTQREEELVSSALLGYTILDQLNLYHGLSSFVVSIINS